MGQNHRCNSVYKAEAQMGHSRESPGIHNITRKLLQPGREVTCLATLDHTASPSRPSSFVTSLWSLPWLPPPLGHNAWAIWCFSLKLLFPVYLVSWYQYQLKQKAIIIYYGWCIYLSLHSWSVVEWMNEPISQWLSFLQVGCVLFLNNCWVGCKWVQPLWKTVWVSSKRSWK